MALSIQKANFWKRISAYLFDAIVAVMLTVGFATVLSAIVGYDKHSETVERYYMQYEEEYKAEYEEKYGVDFDVTQEEYNAYTDAQKEHFQKAQTEYHNAVSKALQSNREAMTAYEKVLSLSFVILSISLLVGVLVVQFVPPLFFHNGQTLGKKIFGLALMRSNCVQISTPVLFIRATFGMYAIETMFPAALLLLVYFGMMGSVAFLTVGLLLILQIGLLIGTKNNSSIHDLLADTIVVDMASQRIFKTQDEMLAYVKEQQAEEAAKAEYI